MGGERGARMVQREEESCMNKNNSCCRSCLSSTTQQVARYNCIVSKAWYIVGDITALTSSKIKIQQLHSSCKDDYGLTSRYIDYIEVIRINSQIS